MDCCARWRQAAGDAWRGAPSPSRSPPRSPPSAPPRRAPPHSPASGSARRAACSCPSPSARRAAGAPSPTWSPSAARTRRRRAPTRSCPTGSTSPAAAGSPAGRAAGPGSATTSATLDAHTTISGRTTCPPRDFDGIRVRRGPARPIQDGRYHGAEAPAYEMWFDVIGGGVLFRPDRGFAGIPDPQAALGACGLGGGPGDDARIGPDGGWRAEVRSPRLRLHTRRRVRVADQRERLLHVRGREQLRAARADLRQPPVARRARAGGAGLASTGPRGGRRRRRAGAAAPGLPLRPERCRPAGGRPDAAAAPGPPRPAARPRRQAGPGGLQQAGPRPTRERRRGAADSTGGPGRHAADLRPGPPRRNPPTVAST